MAKRGRKKLKEEREIREQLEKFLPKIVKFYNEVYRGNNKTLKEKISREILDKLIADRRALELSGEGGGPLGVVILPPEHGKTNDNLEAPSRATDGSSKEN